MKQVLLEKATIVWIVKKFPTFYKTHIYVGTSKSFRTFLSVGY